MSGVTCTCVGHETNEGRHAASCALRRPVEVDVHGVTVNGCARCGKPKQPWQVYCGAACSALAEGRR